MRILTLAATLLISVTAFSQQRFEAAVIAGINASQIDGDQNAGYDKLGFNCGLKVYARLGKYLSLSPELLIVQKGSKGRLVGSPVPYPFTFAPNPFKLTLNYAEIPVLLHYHDKDRAIFGAGLSYSALVGYKRIESGFNTTGSDTPVSSRDISIIADAALKVRKVFALNLRFAYSLFSIADWPMSNIINKNGEHLVYNNVISLRVMWFPKLRD
jgi:hypothetical protein